MQRNFANSLIIASSIFFSMAAPGEEENSEDLSEELRTLDDLAREPLIRKGHEWLCHANTEYVCQESKCMQKESAATYFEVYLDDGRFPESTYGGARYRMCAEGGWLTDPNAGECLEWFAGEWVKSGVFTLVSPRLDEGYLKIKNDGEDFMGVSAFMFLSNKSYFGTCRKK